MQPQQPPAAGSDNAAQLQARLTQLPPARPPQPNLQVPARPVAAPQPMPVPAAAPRPVAAVPARPVAPAPVAPPAPVPAPAPVAPQPMPQPAPQPVAAPPVAPVPSAAPPAIPPIPSNVVITDIAPTPVAPLTQPATPAVPTPPALSSTPSSAVSYQPDAAKNAVSAVAERIDETPQQNSSDIEELIAHQHRLKRLKGLASTLIFIAGVIIAAFLINTFVFQSYYVDGTSMTPTLQNDDRLIIDKVERTWAQLQGRPYIPQRGQVIVLDSSIVGVGGREEQLIKRVIAIPGDTVIIKDGTVTVKNKEHPDGVDMNKELGLTLQPTFIASPLELTIAEGQVFVMGDNRGENGSYDSRAFGPIESSKIVGRLWARILPIEKAKIF